MDGMLILGKTKISDLFITIEEPEIKIEGPSCYFYGYKVNSGIHGDGVFIEWTHQDGEVNIINDRYGLSPAYYYCDGVNFGLSSSIETIVKKYHAKELDYQAIAVFLRTGNFIGDSTPFKHIKSLKPGSIYTISASGLNVVSTKIEFQNISVDRNSAKIKYAALFQNAIHRYKKSGIELIHLPLSGGRDSRHILYSLLKDKNEPVQCLTVRHIPPKANEDEKIAALICRHFNIDHAVFNSQKSILNFEILKNIQTNYCSLDHSWIMPLAVSLKHKTSKVIIDGIAGDVLSESSFVTEDKLKFYEEKNYDALSEKILGPEGYLSSMLKPKYYAKFSRKLAKQALIDELKKHAETPNPVSQYYFWNRTRRNIALSTWRLLANGNHVLAPYLDGELYDFLSSLPASYTKDKKFHTETISSDFPNHAFIPYEKKGETQSQFYFSVYLFFIDLLQYILPSVLKSRSMTKFRFIAFRVLKGVASYQFAVSIIRPFFIPVYLHQLTQLSEKKLSKDI